MSDWTGLPGRMIRKSFKSALESVEHGYELSRALDWGFSDEDIENLAILYRDNENLRTKITDLLEDCNFHTEAADFEEGNFDKYIEENEREA